MGLDSVELVMEFESYFNINIPDPEAEDIRSVQEMVDCAARHLNISSNDLVLKNNLFKELTSTLKQLKITDNTISISDKIFDFVNPDDKILWNELSNRLNLQIPFPYMEKDRYFKKIIPSIFWRPNYNWKEITIDEFITAIAANNCKRIINPKNITNKYEILIAVIAITVDKCGVDVYEVQPHKTFVNDFGID